MIGKIRSQILGATTELSIPLFQEPDDLRDWRYKKDGLTK